MENRQTKKPLISIRNLVKRFDDGHTAVDGISLDIFPKEFFEYPCS